METTIYRHILVPLDLASVERDEHRRATVDRVGELASVGDPRVTLLHVIESIEGGDDEETREFYAKLEKRAEKALRAARDRLGEFGVDAEIATCYGKRGPEIVGWAAQNDADLIVMGSRPVSPEIASRSWPTVSHQVALMAGVDVLLVR